MHVEFVNRPGGPERLVCEAEIIFNVEGPLAGMKLVGFTLWRAVDGKVYVTFPSRSFGAAGERKFFDYLRSCAGNGVEVKRVKEWLLGEFQTRGAA